MSRQRVLVSYYKVLVLSLNGITVHGKIDLPYKTKSFCYVSGICFNHLAYIVVVSKPDGLKERRGSKDGDKTSLEKSSPLYFEFDFKSHHRSRIVKLQLNFH